MTPAHVVVCESSTEAKFYRHVVIDGYYVSRASDVRAYAEKVRERAADACTRLFRELAWVGFVDMSVEKLKYLPCVSACEAVKKILTNG